MNKLPIKILFVDIDQTLFDHEIHEFDFESLKVLKQAQEKGYLVYIATARPYHSVQFLKLFDYLMPDGMITSNGSAVFYKDELIFGKVIPEEVVKEVIKICNKHHMNLEVSSGKERFKCNRWDRNLELIYQTFYDEFPEYRKYNGEQLLTMMVAGPSTWDKEILSALDKNMFHYRFDEYGMDISCSPTQKGPAIRIALNKVGLTKDDAISIGDSDLDITMFEETKYSVAMGNAKDHIKEKATFVCDSISNHGVAKILKEVLDL